jgi:hypothetical protein
MEICIKRWQMVMGNLASKPFSINQSTKSSSERGKFAVTEALKQKPFEPS